MIGGARALGRPSRRTTETIANCSCFYFVVPAKAGTESSGATSLAAGPPLSRRFRGGECVREDALLARSRKCPQGLRKGQKPAAG
jgi:hypothetical protein